MRGIFGLFLVLISASAHGLVSGPGSLGVGDSLISVEGVNETGVVEPHADRASFQAANIELRKLAWSRGLEGFWLFDDATLKLEAGSFTSAAEFGKGSEIYPADRGSFAGLEFAGNFVHDGDKILGVVLRLSPVLSLNEEKFSNPRLDRYGLGIQAVVGFGDKFFWRSFVYQGSGLGVQNPSLAVNTAAGWKLDELVGRPLTVGAGIFVEADLRDRFDARYDAVYSDPGERDRVRAFKYGNVVSVEAEPLQGFPISAQYLEKLGGYDARATKVLTFSLGVRY